MSLGKFIQGSLGHRLLIYVLLFSSTITLVLTAMQLYRDYLHGRSNVEQRLNEIETINLESMASQLWQLNANGLQLQMEGILRHPDIRHILIYDADGKVLYKMGQASKQDTLIRQFPLKYHYRGADIPLGTLQVTATLENVYQHLIDTALVILISQGLKTFLVSLFILFIVHTLITRHLADLSQYALQLLNSHEHPPKPFQLARDKPREDELQQLVDSVNQRAQELFNKHQQLHYMQEILNESQHVSATGNWEWNLVEGELFWSDELYRILGLTKQQFAPDTDDYDELLCAEERTLRHEALQAAREYGRPYNITYRIASAEGVIKTVREQARIDLDDHGHARRILATVQDITQQQAEEQHQQELINHLNALYHASPDMIFLHAADGTLLEVNDNVTANYGYTQEEILKLSIADLSAPGFTNEMAVSRVAKALAGEQQDFEWCAMRKDGSTFPVEVRLRQLLGTSTRGAALIAIVRDTTQQKAHEEQLTESMKHLSRMITVEQVNGQLLQISLGDQDMTSYLQGAIDILLNNLPWLDRNFGGIALLIDPDSHTLKRVAGRRLIQDETHPCQHPAFSHCRFGQTLDANEILHSSRLDGRCTIACEGDSQHPHYQLPLVSGQQEALGVLILYLPEGHEEHSNEIALLHRVTSVLSMGISRRLAEEEIEYQAFHDHLTGLPNRMLLEDRLHHELSRTEREGVYGALLFVDLDNFKHLNDSLGHSVGDELLQQVAQRMSGLVREGDTVSRLGGDEFVIILTTLSADERDAAQQAQLVAHKLQQEIAAPYHLQEHYFHVTPSIGIAMFSGQDESTEELMKHADTAMYQAKTAGRNTWRFYEPRMQALVDNRLSIERDLRYALQRDELQVYLQPQVNNAGQIIGAEALIRWLHPEKGYVPPGEFIPVAEDSGLILPIGIWVMQVACHRFALASKSRKLGPLESISINVCAKQFFQQDFVEQVKQTIASSGIRPQQLMLELTEESLVHDLDEITQKMHALRELGIRFSIDDFGTGYSSLSYLKLMPLDELKIDQSFVRDITSDDNDAAIVKTIIAMAKHLNYSVVAEGVESAHQLAFLKQNGCDIFQGYHFHRPMPMEDFYQLVAEAQSA